MPAGLQPYGLAIAAGGNPWFDAYNASFTNGIATFSNGAFQFYPGPSDGGFFTGSMTAAPTGVYAVRNYSNTNNIRTDDILASVASNGTTTVGQWDIAEGAPQTSDSLAFDPSTGLEWAGANSIDGISANLSAGNLSGPQITMTLPGPNNNIGAIAVNAEGIYGFVFHGPAVAQGSYFIYHFSKSGAILNTFPVPNNDTVSQALPGTGHDIWFVDGNRDTVGKFTESGKFTEYQIPTAKPGVGGLALARSNTVWFTEDGAGKFGIIKPSGQIQEVPLANGDRPIAITSSGRNASVLWFTASHGSGYALGKITL